MGVVGAKIMSEEYLVKPMEIINSIWITTLLVGGMVYLITIFSVDRKWKKEWRLNVAHDTERGLVALIERQNESELNDCICLVNENLKLIILIAYQKVPSVPDPLNSYQMNEELMELMQDMMNRSDGSIKGIRSVSSAA